MGLYRFMMPVIPFTVLCGAIGLYRLLHRQNPGAFVVGVAGIFGLHAANSYVVDDRAALHWSGSRHRYPWLSALLHSGSRSSGKWLAQRETDDYQVVGGAGKWCITPEFARSIALVCPMVRRPQRAGGFKSSGSPKVCAARLCAVAQADDLDLQRLSNLA